MADHVIIQVRDALIAKLVAGVAAVAGRVYLEDTEPTDDSLVPFLSVKLDSDNDTREAIGGTGSSNEPQILEDMLVTLHVNCVVKQDSDPEKAAYNLRRDVEATLLGTIAARTLDGKIPDTKRTGGDNARVDSVDTSAYRLSVNFELQIRHLEQQPDSLTY